MKAVILDLANIYLDVHWSYLMYAHASARACNIVVECGPPVGPSWLCVQQCAEDTVEDICMQSYTSRGFVLLM